MGPASTEIKTPSPVPETEVALPPGLWMYNLATKTGMVGPIFASAKGVDMVQDARTIGRALKTDFAEKKSWSEGGAAALNFLGFLAVEVIGAPKLPTVGAVVLAAKMYEKTGVPGVAALPSALGYYLWCRTSAQVLNGMIDRFPHTAEAVSEALPTHKLNFLPGLEPFPVRETGTRAHTRLGRLGRYAVDSVSYARPKRLPARAARAALMQGPGILPYITASGAQNQSPAERLALRKGMAVDGTWLMGSIAAAMTFILHVVGKQNPELAERFIESTDNKQLWLGIGLVGIPAATVLATATGHSFKKAVHKVQQLKSDRRAKLALRRAVQ